MNATFFFIIAFFNIQVSHMFALNGNPENPCCTGMDGVIEAYKCAVKAVQLSQPTCVAPLINHVAKQAMQHDPNTQVNDFKPRPEFNSPIETHNIIIVPV